MWRAGAQTDSAGYSKTVAESCFSYHLMRISSSFPVLPSLMKEGLWTLDPHLTLSIVRIFVIFGYRAYNEWLTKNKVLM